MLISNVNSPQLTTLSRIDFEKFISQGKKWIIIDGRIYDVGAWLSSHPGGRLLLEHQIGRDASGLVHGYHKISRISKLLRSFDVAALGDDKIMTVIAEHEALFQSLENKEFFQPKSSELALRAIVSIAMFLILIIASVFAGSCTSLLPTLGCGLLCGLLWQQTALFAHDLGHNGVTTNNKIDSLLGLLFGNMFVGVSGAWWKHNHNAHHSLTNHPLHDPDIQYAPVFAVSPHFLRVSKPLFSTFYLHKMDFSDPTARFLVAIQHISILPILFIAARWNLYALSLRHILSSIRKGQHLRYYLSELLGVLLFWLWYSYLLLIFPRLWQRVVFLLVSNCSVGFLHLQIVVSHFAMDTDSPHTTPLEECDFVSRTVRSTMNISCPQWMDW